MLCASSPCLSSSGNRSIIFQRQGRRRSDPHPARAADGRGGKPHPARNSLRITRTRAGGRRGAEESPGRRGGSRQAAENYDGPERGAPAPAGAGRGADLEIKHHQRGITKDAHTAEARFVIRTRAKAILAIGTVVSALLLAFASSVVISSRGCPAPLKCC